MYMSTYSKSNDKCSDHMVSFDDMGHWEFYLTFLVSFAATNVYLNIFQVDAYSDNMYWGCGKPDLKKIRLAPACMTNRLGYGLIAAAFTHSVTPRNICRFICSRLAGFFTHHPIMCDERILVSVGA